MDSVRGWYDAFAMCDAMSGWKGADVLDEDGWRWKFFCSNSGRRTDGGDGSGMIQYSRVVVDKE